MPPSVLLGLVAGASQEGEEWVHHVVHHNVPRRHGRHHRQLHRPRVRGATGRHLAGGPPTMHRDGGGEGSLVSGQPGLGLDLDQEREQGEQEHCGLGRGSETRGGLMVCQNI